MKRQLAVLIIISFSMLLVWGCSEEMINAPDDSEANTSGMIQLSNMVPEEALEIPLIAGQNMQVGWVYVWNDVEYLYVNYEVTEPDWCIKETHLHVATDPNDIPQKNGNPIPGKFDHKTEHETCLTEYLYMVEMQSEWECDEDIIIATHAVVVTPNGDCVETVWQIGDVEEFVVIDEKTSWLSNYADEFNWGFPAGPTTAGPSLAAEQPPFDNPFIVETSYTKKFPYNSNFNRGYATNFDVKWTGELPFGGELIVSWSPGQSAAEMKVVSGGFTTANLSATGIHTPGEGWFLDTYPLVEHSITVDPLPNDEHTIKFEHTKGDGTFWDWVRLEKPCVDEETAWGGGPGFIGSNWATYFVYTIQCEDGSGDGCETAFAYGDVLATCFIGSPWIVTNRWGWTNGPLAEKIDDSYTFDIYAAAGQCDLTKGTDVGDLTVNYFGGTATVTFTMAAGYTLDETQVYVGNEPLPRDGNGNYTVAPGRYPSVKDVPDGPSSDTHTFTGLTGNIYVVAHAGVCSIGQ